MSAGTLYARLRREDGQAAVMLAAGLLVLLLGVAGLVIDVGHAYTVKRKLQASVDAAALAGAAALPDIATASGVAASYIAKNPVPNATADAATGICLASVKYCFGNPTGSTPANGQANGLVVAEHADVPTTFLSLFGVDSISVSATSTACGLCASLPMDIALVVDRTGSMADNIDDLRAGVETFLESLDPTLDRVSLLVLPPATTGDACVPAAGTSGYPLASGSSYPSGSDDDYLVVHLSSDYQLADGELNPASSLVHNIGCIAASGSTSYTQALVAAQTELVQHGSGRANVQQVVVFESDGAANTAPDSDFVSSSGKKVTGIGPKLYSPTAAGSNAVLRPCGSAVDYANGTIKPSGTIVFTVAYQVDQDDECYQAPHLTSATTGVGYRKQRESTTASSTLASIATPGDALSAGTASEMESAFAAIANKITGSALVPDDPSS